MIDVHPPHHPVHAWKDFFLHIATIVVGLLIAVGLEQTVEFFHHREEVRSLREALEEERNENRKLFIHNVAYFRLDRARILNNLRVLLYVQQHPGTPEEKLPGTPVWPQTYEETINSAYRNAQQKGTLGMLPREEAEQDARLYFLLDLMDQATLPAAETALKAGSFAATDPDPAHLSPAELERSIGLLRDALFLNAKWEIWLVNMGKDFPDFTGAPTSEEFTRSVGFIRSPEDQKKLAAAQAQTDEALRVLTEALKATRKANPLTPAAH